MTRVIRIAVCLSFLTFASGHSPRTASSAPQTSRAASSKHIPVLVELFTSEGCSDCPPADALLAKLEGQQPISGAQIIALEEHVDYWDQQGWRDPFSSEQWTERQQRYASARRSQSIYTPQMVVNGRAEFVGSREHQARQEIQQALNQSPAEISLVPLNSTKRDAAQFKVSVGLLAGATLGDTEEVWLAITETGLQSSVTRGENAGRSLHHAAVVRTLRKLGLADRTKEPSYEGEASIKLDPAWNRQNIRAVVFVQENRSRRILGSATSAIEP
jgi:hypothetical protein